MERTTPQDDVLVVTGASSGIGAACARRASDAGYRVVLAARREERLRALVDDLGLDQDRALVRTCDVASWEDQTALVDAALERFGRIDAVVANAGVSAQMGLLESTPQHWQQMVLTNVLGTALTVRATLPHLLEREFGHYVLVSSMAARRPVPARSTARRRRPSAASPTPYAPSWCRSGRSPGSTSPCSSSGRSRPR